MTKTVIYDGILDLAVEEKSGRLINEYRIVYKEDKDDRKYN